MKKLYTFPKLVLRFEAIIIKTRLVSDLSLNREEPCLRTPAIQPAQLYIAKAIIVDALVERVYQREEIGELQAEVKDLEELLADLKKIDEAE